MFHLTFDLELHDPIKKLDIIPKEQFFIEQEITLKKIFSFINKNDIKISCFVTNDFVKEYYDFFHYYIVNHHEIGAHTADHLFYNGTNKVDFIKSIKKNKTLLEKETGCKCQGFRAPGGVVPKDIISILKKLNFKYDTSLLPGIMIGRYNYSHRRKHPYFPSYNNIFISDRKNKEIIEFPLLTSKYLNMSMNGIFFSFYNIFINRYYHDKLCSVLYLHPSDFKKIGLFEKSFFWDKIKWTKRYWSFLKDYVTINKNRDVSLFATYLDLISNIAENE